MTPFFFTQGPLDPRLDETIQHLDDDAALFPDPACVGNIPGRCARRRGRDLLECKGWHVYPLVVELKHSRSSPALEIPRLRQVNDLRYMPFASFQCRRYNSSII